MSKSADKTFDHSFILKNHFIAKQDFAPSPAPDALKLIQLQIIHRHGPRTPLNYRLPQFYSFNWPLCSKKKQISEINTIITTGDESLLTLKSPLHSMPEINDSCLLGQLTDLGRHVMEQLGESLRKHYLSNGRLILKDISQIYIRSTNYPRTIESAYHLLRGLLPQHSPPPINIRDEYLEDMYGSIRCNKYARLLKDFEERYQEEVATEVLKLKESLPHIFQLPDLYGHPHTPYGVYDTISSRLAHRLSLPSCINASVYQKLSDLSYREWFSIFFESPDVIRLGIGRFIGELHENLTKTTDKKLCIYSAHDSSIMPLLAAFSQDTNAESKIQKELRIFPPYGSHIIIEQYEQPNQEHFVRILFNGEPVILPACLSKADNYQGDPSLCHLNTFSAAMKRFIPTDYLGECQ